MDKSTQVKIDPAYLKYADQVKMEATPTIVDDPWKHRSNRMRCSSCMFFVEKLTEKEQCPGHIIGRCRRHAPSMNGYPVVFSDDWCGDHKVDETKI